MLLHNPMNSLKPNISPVMENSFQGKIVAVTGAAGRLGQRFAVRFAELGAIIIAVVRDEQQAMNIPFPPEAEGWAFPVDVTNEEMVSACFAQVGQQFGRLDVLIHAVGSWGMQPLADTNRDMWQQMMDVNLTSAFLCMREAAKLMQHGGCVIGVSSAQGADAGKAQQAAYGAAKAGVVRLVESIAEEYAPMGVTAHVLAPSTILYGEENEGAGVFADDLVDAAVYLCGPAGQAHNGTTLRMYGTAR